MDKYINNLTLKGKISIEDMKFNHIEGGFGKDKKAMLVKDIAEIHNQQFGEINRRINDNIRRFKEGIDIIDLKPNGFEPLGFKIGFTKQSFNQTKNIYILSERGYSKLLKILEDDFAWEQYEKLVDGYFNMRETTKNSIKKVEKLSSVNNAARTIIPVLEKAGMKPENQVYMLKQLYERAGVEIPLERFKVEHKLFDLTTIATRLGIYSTKGNPHSQVVGVIIDKLDITNNEVELTSFEKNGHVGTSYQYTESVIDKVEKWLLDNEYPSQIFGKDKNYKVNYSNQIKKIL